MRKQTLSSLISLSLSTVAITASVPALAVCPRSDPGCRIFDPPPPPPPSSPPLTGTIYPAYYVLTLIYAPPGNGSEVDYGAQSTLGSETDVQNLFKAGVQVSASGTILGESASGQVGFAIGPVDGNSWESSQTTGHTISVQSQSDSIDHETDQFYIMTNAMISMTQDPSPDGPVGPVLTTITTIGGENPNIVPVLVSELRSCTFGSSELAALKPSDCASILSLDPLAVAPGRVAAGRLSSVALRPVVPPDPSRYEYVTTLELHGPDAPGDPIDGFGTIFTREATQGSSTGFNTATTATFSMGTGFNLFGVLGADVMAGLTFEWDYQKTTQSKQGIQASATANLKTTSVGYYSVFNVYYDTLFNSFAFSPPPAVFEFLQ